MAYDQWTSPAFFRNAYCTSSGHLIASLVSCSLPSPTRQNIFNFTFFFTFFSFLYSFLFPTPFFISWCFFQLFPLAFFHLLILYQSLSLLEPTHKIHIHHPSVNFDLLLCKRNINWRRFPCGAIVTAQYRGHLATLGSSFDWKPKIH